MPTRAALLACLLVVVVATGGVAGTVQPSAASTSAQATTITECTVITNPGEYVLGDDIGPTTDGSPCLIIGTDNVSIDGAGHTVDGTVDVGGDSLGESSVADVDLRDLHAEHVITVRGVRDLSLSSVDLDDGIRGLFFRNVTVVDSRLGGGGFYVDEDSRDIHIANNTFDGTQGVRILESIVGARIVDNVFEMEQSRSYGVVDIQSTPGDSDDILVAGNVIDAGGKDGISTSEGVSGITVRNNVVTNASAGIEFLSSGHIVGNDVHDNGVGISIAAPSTMLGDLLVENNTITDNGVGVAAGYVNDDMQLRGNLIDGNAEYGVTVYESGDAVLDARNNDWGDASGPSSAPANDSDAPFADPVTGALANGSGDAVSEGETPGVSNVRFDPVSGDDAPVEPEPESAYYQVDFVEGPAIEQFGAPAGDGFYSDQSRLIHFLHGSDETAVERSGSPSTIADDTAACVAVDSVDVTEDSVTVQFTVEEGCALDLTLASYEKPGSEWSRATASEQVLVDAASGTFGPGQHELTVSLPTNDSESAST
ncbi:right-handed parallel beta-helix repeat-containing protein [Halomarina salina]|uniref:Right-handed parallel beta-helix repeat-containing protein n=1 Tax=Halomarina salina TaxID=1872699 RepID=A0ABD5RK28_9EURY|nr:right-handed parallel beta-helix repeat-containing protein [Halomarina salina]